MKKLSTLAMVQWDNFNKDLLLLQYQMNDLTRQARERVAQRTALEDRMRTQSGADPTSLYNPQTHTFEMPTPATP